MEPVLWTVDGSRVYGEYHAPPRPRRAAGGVVFLHGYPSSLREFGEVPARMAEAGFHCLTFDQRGFGASGGEKGRIGLDRLVPDLDGAVQVLRERMGGRKPLGVVGHSMGGAYAVGYLARRDTFQAAIIAQTVDRLIDNVSAPRRAAYHVAGRLNRRRARSGRPSWTIASTTRYEDLFVSKQAAREARFKPFLQERLNVGSYDFAATMQASKWARQVDVPVLCIESDRDKMVKRRHSAAVRAALAGPTALLEQAGGHSCFLDLDKERVIEACIDWFEQHLAGA